MNHLDNNVKWKKERYKTARYEKCTKSQISRMFRLREVQQDCLPWQDYRELLVSYYTTIYISISAVKM